MRREEFEKMRSLEGIHWWFQGRRCLLRGLLERLSLSNAIILDAGCGTGFAANTLKSAGTIIGLDVSREALIPGNKNEIPCVGSISAIPFEDNTFDLAVALDVLEHLEHESKALLEVYRVIRPGGYLFVTVPACRRLWSGHDIALGHFRRYSVRELNGLLIKAGFRVRNLSYAVAGVFPVAAVYRMLRPKPNCGDAESDLFMIPRPLNSLLCCLMRIESWLAWRMCLPFGLTVFALAQKTESLDGRPPA